MQAPASQVGDDRVDEGLGLLPGGGVRPRRAAPLAGVPVQGELRDHENRRTRIERGTLVVEDAQLGDLAGDRGDLVGAVATLDAQEDDEALARSADSLPRRGGLARGCGDVTGGTRATRGSLNDGPGSRLV